MKQYTKNRGITHEEFDAVREWTKNHKANDHAWKVSIKEIQERNYNLDFKPARREAGTRKDPKELLKEIEGKEKGISDILKDIGQVL